MTSTAWMLMIGLSAADPAPEASGIMEKASCEWAARSINDQAKKAGSELHARCSEIEFLEQPESAEKSNR